MNARKWVGTSLISLLLLLWPGLASAECFKDTDCEGPLVCLATECVEADAVAACAATTDCPSAQVCAEGWCKNPKVHCETDDGTCSVTDGASECECASGIASAGGGPPSGDPPEDEELYAICKDTLAATCGDPGGEPADEVSCANDDGACGVSASGFSCECADGTGFGGASGGTPGGGTPSKTKEELEAECHGYLTECGEGTGPPPPLTAAKCEGKDGSICLVEPGFYACECADGESKGGEGLPGGPPPTADELAALCNEYLAADCGTTPIDGETDPVDGTDGPDPGGTDATDGPDATEETGGTAGGTGSSDGTEGTDLSGTDGEAPPGTESTDPVDATDVTESTDSAPSTDGSDSTGAPDGTDGSGSGTPATPASDESSGSSGCAAGSGPAGTSLALVFLLLLVLGRLGADGRWRAGSS